MPQTLLALGSFLLPPEMERLESHFEVLRLYKEPDPEAALQARRMDIVGIVSNTATPVRANLIEALPNLEIISQFAVGVDNIDLAVAKARGIAVTNTPDVLTDDTADTAMALLLAVARRVCEGDMYVRVGKWLNGAMPLGVSLSGKKVGIVGLGRIGLAIAKRCEAFGMEVAYNTRTPKNVNYKYYNNINELADFVDVMILACSGGEGTRGLVDNSVLKSLGPRGIIVNVSRGTVIDETALLEALASRTIAGAGLDVYSNEPHVPEALVKMDNVVLLPHIGSATVETRTVMGNLVIDNLLAHFGGMPLKTPVAA